MTEALASFVVNLNPYTLYVRDVHPQGESVVFSTAVTACLTSVDTLRTVGGEDYKVAGKGYKATNGTSQLGSTSDARKTAFGGQKSARIAADKYHVASCKFVFKGRKTQ